MIAIYPGSFDPITNGHLDVIERGSRLFDVLVVSVLQNEAKSPLFTVPERMEMLSEATDRFPNVEVDSFNGLLADYAVRRGAGVILRGIRAISDYENELQMALMNRRLQAGLETAFLLAGEAFSFISSRLVKEVIGLGGNITGLVPPMVERRLRERLKKDDTYLCKHLPQPLNAFRAISVSSTMKVMADADKLRREGVDVVDFSAGEPDFPTPDNIKRAAIAAIERELHEVHSGGRNGRGEAGRGESPQGGVRHRLQAVGMHYHGGRQARAVRVYAGAGESRGRGDHTGALLGDLQGHRELRGRQVRLCGDG